MKLGGRDLEPGAPCLVVAEAGSAHGGDLGRGLELVGAAVEAGADAVKFQIIFADEIVHPLTGTVRLPGGEIPLYERFRALERDEEFFARLKEETERRGALFLASVFGPRSLAMLRRLGAAAVKIASPELNHLPLLDLVAGSGLPAILSTGVSTLRDIERALAHCPGSTLLHCVTAYPAPESQYNLRLIPALRAAFGVPVGVSDHSLDPLLVPGAAAALGARLLEKHLTLQREGGGLDDPIALEPRAFASLVRGVRALEAAGGEEALARLAGEFGRERVEQVLGDGIKRLADAEAGYYATTRRSLHAVGDIEAGRALRPEDICIVRSERNLRPGLEPEHFAAVAGRTARLRIPAGQGIRWEDLREGESDELLQLVDEQGRPAGSAPRAACHGNPGLIQAVVHLYLFDPRGRLYLQRRSLSKDTCPGLWDSSVGGHLGSGETPEQALEREAREELGLDSGELRDLRQLPSYLTRTDWESEYVFPFRAVFAGEPRPNPEEIVEGRFESLRDIRRRIRRGPEQFTPHFRIAFARLT